MVAPAEEKVGPRPSRPSLVAPAGQVIGAAGGAAGGGEGGVAARRRLVAPMTPWYWQYIVSG